jgi:hypothetical protein
MTAQLGTLEAVAQSLGKTISFAGRELTPLQARDWLSRFGVALPQSFFDNPAFETPRAAMSSACRDLDKLLLDLLTAAENGDAVDVIAKGGAVIEQIRVVIQSFSTLQAGISAAAAGLPGIPANRIANIVDNFAAKLLDTLIADQADRLPALGELLTFFGLIERTEIDADASNSILIDGEIPHLNFTAAQSLLQGPQTILKELYDWGASGFDGAKLFPALAMVLLRSGLPAFAKPAQGGQPAKLDAVAFDVTVSAGSPPGLNFMAAMDVDGVVDLDAPYLPPDWSLRLQSSLTFPTGTKISLDPPFEGSVIPPSGAVQGNITLTGAGQPATPYLLFGTSGSSRLEIASVNVSADLGLAWNAAAVKATAAPSLSRSSLAVAYLSICRRAMVFCKCCYQAFILMQGSKRVLDLIQRRGFILKVVRHLKLHSPSMLILAP